MLNTFFCVERQSLQRQSYAIKCDFFLKKRTKQIFAYILEFILTLAKMQDNSTLLRKKFDIWGWRILEVNHSFHTVRIVL